MQNSEEILTPESIKHQSLSSFLESAASKFDRGQREHGGLLTDRDCFAELEGEIIDFWHYYSAEKIRRKRTAAYIAHLEAEVIKLRAILQFNGGHNGDKCDGTATPHAVSS